jgi:predicted transcriptional regulator
VATSVKTIIAGKDFPICVSQRDKVEYALDLMSANDYSQLPVIDENKQPIGLVNANSILYRLVEFGTIDDNLMIGSVMGEFRSVDESDVISDVLEKLEKHAAVLVIDAENKLKAIITQYDVTEYFRRRAENIMLVEDIEQNIREHIQNAIPDAKRY